MQNNNMKTVSLNTYERIMNGYKYAGVEDVNGINESKISWRNDHSIQILYAVLMYRPDFGSANGYAPSIVIAIPEKLAIDLREQGVSVRQFYCEEADDFVYAINAKIKFRYRNNQLKPEELWPNIRYMTPRKKGQVSKEIKLNEETMNILDNMLIKDICLILNIYDYDSKTTGSGKSVALQSFKARQFVVEEFGGVYASDDEDVTDEYAEFYTNPDEMPFGN